MAASLTVLDWQPQPLPASPCQGRRKTACIPTIRFNRRFLKGGAPASDPSEDFGMFCVFGSCFFTAGECIPVGGSKPEPVIHLPGSISCISCRCRTGRGRCVQPSRTILHEATGAPRRSFIGIPRRRFADALDDTRIPDGREGLLDPHGSNPTKPAVAAVESVTSTSSRG